MPYVSDTMTDYMVEGLVKKRAAIAGEMKATQDKLASLAADLETLDNALRVVAPDLDLAPIAPKLFRPPSDWSKRGEMSRHILAVLRASQRPLTSREIASQMIVQKGLACTPKLLNTMTRRVAGCLRDRREQGLVVNPDTRTGVYLEWQIAS